VNAIHTFIAGSFIYVVVDEKNEDKVAKICVRERIQHERSIIGVVSVRMMCEAALFSIWQDNANFWTAFSCIQSHFASIEGVENRGIALRSS